MSQNGRIQFLIQKHGLNDVNEQLNLVQRLENSNSMPEAMHCIMAEYAMLMDLHGHDTNYMTNLADLLEDILSSQK